MGYGGIRYHNITHDDMLNGDGLRVVLWVAGCSHHCNGCQNPLTWNPDSGLIFDDKALFEIFESLEHKWISGITLSGGDPLHENNLVGINYIIDCVRRKYPGKTIWIYTGYTIEQIKADDMRWDIVSKCDVLVDGKFEEELCEPNYEWAGSTNQRVIRIADIKDTKQNGEN